MLGLFKLIFFLYKAFNTLEQHNKIKYGHSSRSEPALGRRSGAYGKERHILLGLLHTGFLVLAFLSVCLLSRSLDNLVRNKHDFLL